MSSPARVKVAFNVPADFAVWTFHRGMLRALLEQQFDVTVIGPPGEYVDLIRQMGTSYITVDVDRFLHPAKDIALLKSYYQIFRREKFAIVHNHTIKPNIYGTLAAKMAGVPTILASVRGRGSVFNESPSLKRKLLKQIVIYLYTTAFRFAERVQFLNPDDQDLFVSMGTVDRDKTVLIRSSGIDLTEFSPNQVDPSHLARLRAELGIGNGTRVVTMVARAYWSKGLREFLTAVQALSPKYQVKFLLVGSIESGPDAAPEEYVRQHESEGFSWPGYRKDIREMLALSDIVVLPSYQEGVPRSLLEAMAMEKPIITTDAPGCREVIEHGRNGLKIPVKDADALTNAIETLLKDRKKCLEFGQYSRQKAQQEFDEKLVVHRVLTELYKVDAPGLERQVGT